MDILPQLNVPTLVVGTLLGVIQLALGIAIGRWLLGGRKPAEWGSLDARHARELLTRIQQMAQHVAAEVGQHRTDLESAGNELTSLRDDRGATLDAAVLRVVGRIVDSNESLQSKLASAEIKLQRQAEQIEVHVATARTDVLTGLPNRRAFEDELTRRMAEWRRRKTPVTLLLIDIDHFKKLNDTHGHLAGDAVLRSLGRVMFGVLRELDLLARYGGEEFAAVLPATTLDAGRLAAERVRSAVEAASASFEDRELKATVSIGLADALLDDENEHLIKRADEALYAAKAAGRNRVQVYERDAIEHVDPIEAEALRKSHAAAEFDGVCEELREHVLAINEQRF